MFSTVNNQYTTSLYQNFINRSSRAAVTNSNFMGAVSQACKSAPATGATSTALIDKSIDTKTKLLPDDVGIEQALCVMGDFKGNKLAVYKSSDFNEDNPTYVVKGTYKGEDYEVAVNVNDVKANGASLIEMAALQTHLKETGAIDNVALLAFYIPDSNGYPVEQGLFEKYDYVQVFKDMYARNLNNQYYEHVLNLSKILSALK